MWIIALSLGISSTATKNQKKYIFEMLRDNNGL